MHSKRHAVTIHTRPEEGVRNIAGVSLDGKPIEAVQAVAVESSVKSLTRVTVTFLAESIATEPVEE